MKPLFTFLIAAAIVLAAVAPAQAAPAAYTGFPTFSIVSVEADKTVTIKTSNFPANDTFNVLMGAMGTKGINGVKVDSVTSGTGGSFTETFDIPASLVGKYQIAIRLESPTSGYFAYNWFFNNTEGAVIPSTGYTGFPTFSITAVDADVSVTIKTANLPPSDTFNVLMGKMGTRGINGVKVDSFDSGTGGVQTLTFDIPASLKGLNQISIRIESPTSGYFAYNWFVNNTEGAVIPPTGYTGFPTFSIVDVNPGVTVTIKTANLPPSDTFDVLMGKMGTLGVNGVKVTSFDTGTGGAQTKTFNIPSSLTSEKQIAIRIQSPTSGYFAYNWFFNTSEGAVIPPTGYSGFPTFSISSVVRNTSVTIKVVNLPPDDTFNVLMGAMGTKGVNGEKVGTIDTGDGGTQTLTFNIPSKLAGAQQIAIRIQSASSGYFAFNWFLNFDA